MGLFSCLDGPTTSHLIRNHIAATRAVTREVAPFSRESHCIGLHLISSEATLKAIKLGDARRPISDGGRLYLLLLVKGGSHGWRFDDIFETRHKTLSLGTYPNAGLGAARQKAAEARQRLTTGVDPSQVRQQKKHSFVKQRQIEQLVEAGRPVPESFEAVAREWFGKHAPTWANSHRVM